MRIVRDFGGEATAVTFIDRGKEYVVTYDRDAFEFPRKFPPELIHYLKLAYSYLKPQGEVATLEGKPFRCWALYEAAGANELTDSYGEDDTPEHWLTARPTALQYGLIKEIHIRLNPTNAATYQFRLYTRPTANNYQSAGYCLYASAAGLADDTFYQYRNLDIPFSLALPGRMDYTLTWSVAPGNTAGVIYVTGICLKELTSKENDEWWNTE